MTSGLCGSSRDVATSCVRVRNGSREQPVGGGPVRSFVAGFFFASIQLLCATSFGGLWYQHCRFQKKSKEWSQPDFQNSGRIVHPIVVILDKRSKVDA